MSHDTDAPLPATLDEVIGLTPERPGRRERSERSEEAGRRPRPEPPDDPGVGGLLGTPATAPPTGPLDQYPRPTPRRPRRDPRPDRYPPEQQRPVDDPRSHGRAPQQHAPDDHGSNGYAPPQFTPSAPQQYPSPQYPPQRYPQDYDQDPFSPDPNTPEAFPSTRYALHPDLAGQARHSGQHRPAGSTAPETTPAGIRRPDPISRRAHHGRAAPVAAPADPQAWVLTLVGVVAGLGLWEYALHHWDLDAAGPRGIVSTIPPAFGLAVLVLAACAAIELSRKAVSAWRMTLVVVALVLMMFGLPNLVDNTGAPPTEYLHVGFIGYIAAHGELLHHADARFSWPAFFTAGAYLQHVAGLENVRTVMTWASIVYELLYLAPMILLTRRFLSSERARWIAVVVFYAGLWFEQDYFSPQATAYLFMLTILAVMFWVSPDRQGKGRFWGPVEHAGANVSPRTEYALEILLAIVMTAMVVGHQLTPLFMIIALVILRVLRATKFRMFWLVTSLVFVAWFSYGARDYWSSNLDAILGNVGQVGKSVNKGLTKHVSGNAAYQQMQFIRILWSAAFAVTGLGGLVLMLWRRSANTLTVGALAFSPFLLMGVQSYGGEVILRCFLYAMPFLAILVGTLVEPILDALRAPLRVLLVAPLVAVLALGLVVVRGANIPFERVRPPEMSLAEELANQVPAHAVIGVVEPFTPLQYTGVGSMRVVDLSTADPTCSTELATCVTKTKGVDYLYLSKSQEARDQDRENLPSGWLLKNGVKQIVLGKQFQVLEQNQFAVVLKRVASTGTRTTTSNQG